MTLTIGTYVVIDNNNTHAVYPTSVYEMNKEPVYNTWTDANCTEHRDYIRTKISGSLTAVFTTITEFQAFLTTLSAADHVYSVTATVTNTGNDETFTAYVDVTCAVTTDLAGGAAVYTAKIEVTEL